jgi:hypothetical protein
MKNNSYEEVISPSSSTNIVEFHKDMLVNKVGLPKWVLLKCPYCKEELSKSAIRSIAIKLNARNIGDVCVEFLCSKCEMGNTLYFTKAASTIQDFINLLNDAKNPATEAITEEEMYKQRYHNTVDAMIPQKET